MQTEATYRHRGLFESLELIKSVVFRFIILTVLVFDFHPAAAELTYLAYNMEMDYYNLYSVQQPFRCRTMDGGSRQSRGCMYVCTVVGERMIACSTRHTSADRTRQKRLSLNFETFSYDRVGRFYDVLLDHSHFLKLL